jgi:PST family polysaccharide transporter
MLLARVLSGLYEADAFVSVFVLTSSTLLLMPYTALGWSLLRRETRFREVAQMEMLAFTVSSVLGLIAAVAGAGVYSLIMAGIIGMLINMVIIAWRLRWSPGPPRLGSVRSLPGYARFVTINNAIGVSSSRVDNMFVGALLGTTALGLYNRAFSLARIPTDQVAESIGPLLLGSFARVQDEIEVSRKRWFAAVTAIAAVTWPFLAVLFVSGPGLIGLLYGEAWQGAGGALQVMVIGAAFLVPALTLRSLINAQGLALGHARRRRCPGDDVLAGSDVAGELLRRGRLADVSVAGTCGSGRDEGIGDIGALTVVADSVARASLALWPRLRGESGCAPSRLELRLWHIRDPVWFCGFAGEVPAWTTVPR